MKKISIIVPTKNEPNIRSVIKELKMKLEELSDKYSYEIIVIDKSNDGTYEKALKENVDVYKQKTNGYGNAYIEGFSYASGSIIVMIDGDGSYSVEKLSEFVTMIGEKHYDFAIGNRFADLRPGSLSAIKKIGNYILTYTIRILFKTDVKDSQCGLRAFSRKFLENINYECFDMDFASEMVIKAKLYNFKKINIPITYYPRIGSSKISTWRHGLLIFFTILRLFLKYKLKPRKMEEKKGENITYSTQ